MRWLYTIAALVLLVLAAPSMGGEFFEKLGTPPPFVSIGNSSTDTLDADEVFTGVWEDVGDYQSLSVSVATDQNGTYTVQFSPDGVNADSTLTRYYRTTGIEPPHRFTITRRFARIVFTNGSDGAQTYFRLQTIYGDKADLNAPIDSTLARDFDAIVVRPTDETREIVLGRRQGMTHWNKFGYNQAIGTTAEVVAPWGPTASTFAPRTTATTLSLVSTSTADDDGSTGAHGVVIYGIDANRDSQTEVVLLDGTNPVVTTSTWLGINRAALFRAGTGLKNAGVITVTGVTGGTTEAQIAIGEGTSQQCIFYSQLGHQSLIEWITLNVARFGSGTEPVVTIKGMVYSPVSNAVYEVFRQNTDATLSGTVTVQPAIPFPITEGTVFWLEAVSTRADTIVNARFSLIEARNVND